MLAPASVDVMTKWHNLGMTPAAHNTGQGYGLSWAVVKEPLGELMLSPMGLSLVSKVAPVSKRGLMMGGWFVATGIGNKLTQIGVYWTEWLHSTFWLVRSLAALIMAVVLFFLLKPLKKAMPGI